MAIYAIGDLQGCYSALRRLLDKIDFQPQRDTLWFTGDLINRGPESLATLNFIQSLGSSALSVLGNHDLHLLAVAQGLREYKTKDSFEDILTAANKDEILHWLRHQKLLHYDKSLGYTMTHAGIYPTWSLSEAKVYAQEVETVLQSDAYPELLHHLYGNEPNIWTTSLSHWDRLRFITNALTRMRYLSADLALDFACKTPVEGAHPGLKPWFDYPVAALKETRIVFGHWSALRGYTGIPEVQAIDTGCVWGFELTALNLETNARISVTAA